MTLQDFRPGDHLVITSRTRQGEERRAAEVTCLDYRSNGLVTYAGRYHNPEKLIETGQGAFHPTEYGADGFRLDLNEKPYGLVIRVEKVGHSEPWKPADTGFMFRNPGYDLMY